jgi:hypothetical protein
LEGYLGIMTKSIQGTFKCIIYSSVKNRCLRDIERVGTLPVNPGQPI